ncbi:MAG: hypothetical protein AAGI38_12270 [Bacteroidota bacterium]
MIPLEIQNIIQSLDFEEESFIRLAKITFHNNLSELIIEIFPGTDELSRKNWKIVVFNPKGYEINSNQFDELRVAENHCLLLDHNELWGELFINQRTDYQGDLFRELYAVHRKEFFDWIPFDKYIPHTFDNLDKFELDYGSFARGPLSILEVYGGTLKKFYSKVSIVGAYGRKEFKEGIGLVPDAAIYKVLLMDGSFIIGEKIVFEKLP